MNAATKMSNAPASYFHTDPRALNIGDIIEPGNYGRIIEERGESHPYWERERVLEEIRKAAYPHLPSRLSCSFVIDDWSTAVWYQVDRTNGDNLYIVQPVDPAVVWHRSDMNCLQPVLGKTMEEIAHGYWKANIDTVVREYPGLKFKELIGATALRVLGRIRSQLPNGGPR